MPALRAAATRYSPFADPSRIAAATKAIPGVAAHGLFIDLVQMVIVVAAGGARTYQR